MAVVGALPNPSFVSDIFKNLLRYGFEGPVAAINPKYDRILDAPCYPSIPDLPEPVDLVREIDVNPLVVFEAGRGACAVDCLIVPAEVPGPPSPPNLGGARGQEAG